MTDLAATVAFGLLIGGQFLGAIYLLSKRSTLYPDQLFRRRGEIQDAALNGVDGPSLSSVAAEKKTADFEPAGFLHAKRV